MSAEDSGTIEQDTMYWLVYLYRYEPEEPMGFLWSPVGIVEDRQTWKDWWADVQSGVIELPGPYGRGDWWVSDRPVSFGLYEGEDDE